MTIQILTDHDTPEFVGSISSIPLPVQGPTPRGEPTPLPPGGITLLSGSELVPRGDGDMQHILLTHQVDGGPQVLLAKGQLYVTQEVGMTRVSASFGSAFVAIEVWPRVWAVAWHDGPIRGDWSGLHAEAPAMPRSDVTMLLIHSALLAAELADVELMQYPGAA